MFLLFRSLGMTLALGAMLLRAVLPTGWMPNSGGTGTGPLVICSIDGAHYVPPAHAPMRGTQDDHGYVCPFGTAAQLAPPQMPFAVPQPISIAWLALPFAKDFVVVSPQNSRHVPRGPPADL